MANNYRNKMAKMVQSKGDQNIDSYKIMLMQLELKHKHCSDIKEIME